MLSNFEIGYVIACCNVSSMHGEPDIASWTLLELGKSKSEIMRGNDWDESDIATLNDIFEMNARWADEDATVS